MGEGNVLKSLDIMHFWYGTVDNLLYITGKFAKGNTEGPLGIEYCAEGNVWSPRLNHNIGQSHNSQAAGHFELLIVNSCPTLLPATSMFETCV